MLGSHNTLSYLPPKGIISKILNIWAKCQEVDYIEQYNLGVQYFDIRIRFDKNKPIIVHNDVTYKGGETTLNNFFSFINNKQDCHIRLGLDIRKTPKNEQSQVALFKEYIQYIQTNFPLIKIDDAITFWNWEHIIIPTVQVIEKHASVTSTIELIKTPRHYSKQHNKEIREQYKDVLNSNNKSLLIDFVNI